MAGDEVRMADNALLMIHNPWTMSMGGAEQLRKDADLLDKMEANIRNAYSRSALTSEEIDAAMEAETYYTAEEALEAGFIDEIDGANLAAASIGDMETLKDFASVPQAKIDDIKIECQARQIESLNAKLADRDGQVEALDAKAIELSGELETAKAELEEANTDAEKLKSEHVDALTKATEQTSQAIADKAAELMAEAGHPAIPDEPNNDLTPHAAKMTEEEFWNKYNSIPVDEQNTWYTENSHLIK
jgi:chromosome segregation ATPase